MGGVSGDLYNNRNEWRSLSGLVIRFVDYHFSGVFGRNDNHSGGFVIGYELFLIADRLFVDLVDDVPEDSVRLRLKDNIVVSVHEEGDKLVGTEQVQRLKMSL